LNPNFLLKQKNKNHEQNNIITYIAGTMNWEFGIKPNQMKWKA
jgi:hypothetical protein